MTQNSRRRAEEESPIARIKARIAKIDLVCTGTLRKRTKVCGKALCRCATDEQARHGPYWEWSRREDGRLVQHAISAAQAVRMARALRNTRAVHRLLALWERESLRIIKRENDASS